ncbi:DUF3231 family protein, partial [Paenibacillus chartarius]
ENLLIFLLRVFQKLLLGQLHEVIHDVHKPIQKEVIDFLTAEGVPLPAATADKPVGDFRAIPQGARLSDMEVANLLSFNIVLGINYACRGMTEAVRPDVAAMFLRFLTKKTLYAIPLRDMMAKKGWMQVPPIYKPEAAPVK